MSTLSSRPESPPVQIQPRFIVSTGRCGSTLLSSLLAAHPSVLTLPELFAAVQPHAFSHRHLAGTRFWALLSQPQEAWTFALRERIEPSEFLYPVDDVDSRFGRDTGVPPVAAICLPAISDDPDALYSELEEVVPRFIESDVATLYRRLFEWLCDRLSKPIWIERSGGSLMYARDLVSAFPDGKFLHLYRDGRETALSMSRHAFFRMQLAKPAVGRPADSEQPTAGTHTWESRRTPDIGSREAKSALALRDDFPVERFGVRWSAAIVNGTAALDNLPAQNVNHISYEELVSQPARKLRQIIEFFEIPNPGEQWIRAAASTVVRRPARSPHIPLIDQQRLAKACEVGERRLRSLTSR